MRPKARRLAQHGRPPGWLEESDPTGMILYAIVGPCRLPGVLYRLPCLPNIGLLANPAAEKAAAAAGILVNVHNPSTWAMSRKEGMAWNSRRPMPSLWFGVPKNCFRGGYFARKIVPDKKHRPQLTFSLQTLKTYELYRVFVMLKGLCYQLNNFLRSLNQ